MNYEDVKKLDEKYVLHTYERYPLALEKGSGCKVWDSEGNEYLDLLAGIAVNILGYSHPNLVKAITDQANKLIHTSNFYYIEQQDILAKMLNDLAPMKTKMFFSNSGAEANEAAIKFSRKSSGKREIISMSNSFHGRTIGSLSITDKKKYQKPFEPLMPETRVVEYGNIESIKSTINDNTAAIFVELIQGEGGVKFPCDTLQDSVEYVKEIREICDDNEIIMVIDEVQTGSGRTGEYFASKHFGVIPDILTTAKGVAGGFPMGVTLVNEKIASCIVPGDHGSTFGGSPLACAAGIATIETILEDELLDNATEMGTRFTEGIEGSRGLGLIMGKKMESEEKAKAAMVALRDRGILVNVTNHDVLRLLPPLIISKEETDFAIDNINEVLK